MIEQRAEILRLIAMAPISESNKNIVRRLLPDLLKVCSAPRWARMVMRNRLNAYMSRYKQGSTPDLVAGCVVYIIKRVSETPLRDQDVTDNHIMSDHAFCAAMRRLGYDVEAFKDKAMAEATRAGLMPIYVGNGEKIVTFIPRPA